MKPASQSRTIIDHGVRGGATTPIIVYLKSPMQRVGNQAENQALNNVFRRLRDDENLVYLTARVENYSHLTESRMAALKQALDAGDADGVAVIAHALTDAITRIGAAELMKLSISLQMLGRGGMLEAAARTYEEFEKNYRAFKRNLISEWR